MVVGALGDIVFEVSEKEIKTLRDVSWKGSARISTHARHLQNALQEFEGVDPDEVSFNIRVSKYLGSLPLTAVRQIFNYERNGIPQTLVIGKQIVGKYKWLIKNHTATYEEHDAGGTVSQIDIKITLTEYTSI